MAKGKKKGYILKCPGCGHEFESGFKRNPCAAGCGRMAVSVDEIVIEPDEKPAEDTKHRPAEEGGRTF